MEIFYASQNTAKGGVRINLESTASIIQLNQSAWPVFLFLLGLVGCAVGPDTVLTSPTGDGTKYIYKLYAGDHKPLDKLAVVEMVGANYAVIDGYHVDRNDYYTVHLDPGEYWIGWGNLLDPHTLTDPDNWWHAERKGIEVTFLAGHRYELYATEGSGTGIRKFFWIIDSGSGELISGEKRQ